MKQTKKFPHTSTQILHAVICLATITLTWSALAEQTLGSPSVTSPEVTSPEVTFPEVTSPPATSPPVTSSQTFPAPEHSNVARSPQAERLDKMKISLAKQYPDVQHVSITDFIDHHQQATLIDVRDADEFAVSHIPGAIHINNTDELLAFAQQHDGPIVVYCSVGARSAAAAQFLNENQVDQVANLAGSIFEWSNEQRPLVNATGPTREVHPYNAWWGWRYLTQY